MSSVGSEDVLSFWFGSAVADRSDFWFRGGSAVDELCRQHFSATWQAAANRELEAWKASPRGTLAWVILLDQFSRNLHRGTAQAFAHDAAAKAAAEAVIRTAGDLSLTPFERAFLYLPFEHSESIADQDESVRLFQALLPAFTEEQQQYGRSYLDFAQQHREVIRRFGRFPHRNTVLGRVSTADETTYLHSGGARFGQ